MFTKGAFKVDSLKLLLKMLTLVPENSTKPLFSGLRWETNNVLNSYNDTQKFQSRHILRLFYVRAVMFVRKSCSSHSVPAPQSPDGLRPVCIQSLFILCSSLRAVMDTSWVFSPNSNMCAKRGIYRHGSGQKSKHKSNKVNSSYWDWQKEMYSSLIINNPASTSV